MNNPVEYIPTREDKEQCGRGHACGFCPQESSCQLDKEHHNREHIERRLARINWVVPVLANKGGVGKSTVSANLAVALARQGYAVGLADADIHGPNAARLFGLQTERVMVSEAGVKAPEYQVAGRGSLRVGSLAYFLEEPDTPVVWRDAYKHDYIHHLLGSFDWGVLDFLIVDMPPGTGNELITLGDLLKGCNTSALLVSSADAIALQDTLKAARYCRDTAVPVLGMVENYAGTICPHCGGEFEMFPRAPEIEQFQAQGIDTLARLPFTPAIGSGAAAGAPVAGDVDSPLSGVFMELAGACRDRMVQQQREMLT
jgi:Mrp family chromosome partitioning ATPase